jgi:hypothetical protein
VEYDESPAKQTIRLHNIVRSRDGREHIDRR